MYSPVPVNNSLVLNDGSVCTRKKHDESLKKTLLKIGEKVMHPVSYGWTTRKNVST